VLSSWGLTPIQAGIFATGSVNLTDHVTITTSTSFTPATDQKSSVSAQMAQSVSSILWLNETLPPFMTREFAVAPFTFVRQSKNKTGQTPSSILGHTTRYGVNISCETPTPWLNGEVSFQNSTWGCSIQPINPIGPYSVNASTKPYFSTYIGWSNTDGSADYYLKGLCPSNESNSFYIQWDELVVPLIQYINPNLTTEQKQNMTRTTRQYCRTSYFEQAVEVNTTYPDFRILSMKTTNDSYPLPGDIFNVTSFEATMNLGHSAFPDRSEFPTSDWPKQESFLTNLPLNTNSLPIMSQFAIASTQLTSMDNYFNASILVNSYQAAYRILFARQMSQILISNPENGTSSAGLLFIETQAIVLVPAFARIAQGFLAICIMMALALWSYYRHRPLNLTKDPATIKTMMEMTANDPNLLKSFMAYDNATTEKLEEDFSKSNFQLTFPSNSSHPAIKTFDTTLFSDMVVQRAKSFKIIRGIQPTEFKLWIIASLLGFLVSLIVGLAVLFAKSHKENGMLSYPS
jgi:hypothetical protein